MTEAEWLACEDPPLILGFLQSSGNNSERKRRLFACACCRRVWQWMLDDRSRQAVETCEKYANAEVGQKALNAARRAAFAASKSRIDSRSVPGYPVSDHAAVVALNACINIKRGERSDLAYITAGCASSLVAHAVSDAAEKIERASQCCLVRDIFGSLPFRPVTLDPVWVQWNAGTVRKMAQAIYDDRALDQLPILADALEEAGCDNRDVLDHCRSGGDHVRGCWVVDLLLGKE